MRYILDKILMFCCCSAILIYSASGITFSLVSYFLLALCLCLLSHLFNYDCNEIIAPKQNIYYCITLAVFVFLTFVQPAFCFYIPIIMYDLLFYKNKTICAICAISIVYNFQNLSLFQLSIIIVLITFASIMYYRSYKTSMLENKLKVIRDTSTELNMMLSKKNKDLIDKQNYEIRVATLKERNRIAREIHDNVGHMLSRSIIQLGALKVINQNDAIDPQLNSLKDSLDQAMNSIRSSVHDLHDDSIDLQNTINEILRNYKNNYQIFFDYDMSENIPKNIKYCYISIVKEAMSNITKHSNASKVTILMREHPSLFQLIISDNGTDISINHCGIGLENMEERIKSFNGTFSYNTKNGFSIFTAIPKTQ